MKIGFIGFGNMAQALASGLIYKGAIAPDHIYASAVDWEKLQNNTAPRGIQPCHDNKELVSKVDLVILAVKPHQVQDVLNQITDQLQGKILISVVVDLLFEKLEELLPTGIHHLSILPNTPVSVGEGIIIREDKSSLTIEEEEIFHSLFRKIALIQTVPSQQFGIAGTISGCGPAFVSMFIESLSDAAVLHGLPREVSYRLVSQMLIGTGQLQITSGTHPGILKDAVCSPGGTTIVGVTTLERKGFRSALIDAVDAIMSK